MRRSWLRITSRPFGSVYFSKAMRGLSAVDAAGARFCAEEDARPATTTRATSRRRMEERVCMTFTFTTEYEANSGSLFARSVIEACPQVPARDRTIGPPAFTNACQPIGRWRL